MSASLLQQEAAADAAYGFPAGTLEALGATESSQGTNLGSIGNVFQILPSTAANPGYGLGQLDGNNPMDAGAYLNALLQGPAGGNLATAFAMYQGGAGNPTPYGSNTPVANFLASLTGSSSSSAPVSSSAGTSEAPVQFGLDGTPIFGTGGDNSAAGTAAANSVNSAISSAANSVNGAISGAAKSVTSSISSAISGLFSGLTSWLTTESANIGFVIVGVVILIGALLLFGKDGVEKVT
jgi:hypothetical protein